MEYGGAVVGDEEMTELRAHKRIAVSIVVMLIGTKVRMSYGFALGGKEASIHSEQFPSAETVLPEFMIQEKRYKRCERRGATWVDALDPPNIGIFSLFGRWNHK
jgi:hypothetical protein